MLDGWSVCIGAKSSGDCQVASAQAKYWRGQKMRSCCSLWSAWWRTTWSPCERFVSHVSKKKKQPLWVRSYICLHAGSAGSAEQNWAMVSLRPVPSLETADMPKKELKLKVPFALYIGWRPLFLGWRLSLVGWRPSLFVAVCGGA